MAVIAIAENVLVKASHERWPSLVFEAEGLQIRRPFHEGDSQSLFPEVTNAVSSPCKKTFGTWIIRELSGQSFFIQERMPKALCGRLAAG